jgi:hypothetical protein
LAVSTSWVPATASANPTSALFIHPPDFCDTDAGKPVSRASADPVDSHVRQLDRPTQVPSRNNSARPLSDQERPPDLPPVALTTWVRLTSGSPRACPSAPSTPSGSNTALTAHPRVQLDALPSFGGRCQPSPGLPGPSAVPNLQHSILLVLDSLYEF